MPYAKPKAMVIEQTYQSDFMRCFNISLHVIDRNLDTNWYNKMEKP